LNIYTPKLKEWTLPFILGNGEDPNSDTIGVSTYGCGHIIHHAILPW
jgi:hypothetical protein